MISGADPAGGALIVAYHALSVVSAFVCLAKGKWIVGVIGFLLWPVGLVGAVRLAQPDSFWARRIYESREDGAAVERYRADEREEPPAARDGSRAARSGLDRVVPLLAQEALELLGQLVAGGERAEGGGLVDGPRLELLNKLLEPRLGRDGP